jgi:nucleotide-binding universal stress UspA family protein
VFNVSPPDEVEGDPEAQVEARIARGRSLMQQAGASDVQSKIDVVRGRDPVEEIIRRAKGYDLLVVGATTEPVWRNYLFGAKPELITERFPGSVLMVKSHMGRRTQLLRGAGRRLRRIASLLRPD